MLTTITKTKIGIVSLVLASFVAGGIAFNAHQVSAFGGFHRFGFFGSDCDLSGLERGSAEWQEKVNECRTERQKKMEEFRLLTPEERQAKIEEMRANWSQNAPFKGCGIMFCRMFGPEGLKNTKYLVENIANGVKITITSDDADTVSKIQEWAARLPVANQ